MPLARAEKIPMRSGKPVNYTIQEYTGKGIKVRTPGGGSVVIPWSEVSPAFPKHPEHVAAAPRPAAKPGVTAPGGGGKESGPAVSPGSGQGPVSAAAPPPGAAPAAGKEAVPLANGGLAGDPVSYLLGLALSARFDLPSGAVVVLVMALIAPLIPWAVMRWRHGAPQAV